MVRQMTDVAFRGGDASHAASASCSPGRRPRRVRLRVLRRRAGAGRGGASRDFLANIARRSSRSRCSRRRLCSVSEATPAAQALDHRFGLSAFELAVALGERRDLGSQSLEQRAVGGAQATPGRPVSGRCSMTEFYHGINALIKKKGGQDSPLSSTPPQAVCEPAGSTSGASPNPSNRASNCACESRITPVAHHRPGKAPLLEPASTPATSPVPSHPQHLHPVPSAWGETPPPPQNTGPRPSFVLHHRRPVRHDPCGNPQDASPTTTRIPVPAHVHRSPRKRRGNLRDSRRVDIAIEGAPSPHAPRSQPTPIGPAPVALSHLKRGRMPVAGRGSTPTGSADDARRELALACEAAPTSTTASAIGP